jgi:hypothetical protein
MGIQHVERGKSTLNSSEKLLLYSVYYTQLVYVLIIWIFTWDRILTNTLPNDLFFALYIFVCIGIFSTIITYKYIIPKMMKKDDAHRAFFILLMVMLVGSEVPSLLGLIYAIIGLVVFNTLYWQIGLIFIILGFSHGIYLHIFKIQPFLNELKNE